MYYIYTILHVSSIKTELLAQNTFLTLLKFIDNGEIKLPKSSD